MTEPPTPPGTLSTGRPVRGSSDAQSSASAVFGSGTATGTAASTVYVERRELPANVACVGGGVIGSAWAARFVLSGVDVTIADPSPEAERIAAEVVANAERAWDLLGLPTHESVRGTLTVTDSIAAAVADADHIQESVPERLDLKQKVLAEIEASARPDAVIASSTSGFRPSVLQSDLVHPERLVVGHPFNPVYLLPLVEVVAGGTTDPAVMERAQGHYRAAGMKPLHVRVEIDAFIADRLLEAVWREGLWLVADGVATTEEIDDAIRYGFGLRWAQMGMFETYRVAGGEAGMRHFIAQFGEALAWPWTKLTDVPELTDELIDTIADQSDDQSGHHSIRSLEQIRDANLAAILLALESNDWGAGQTLARHRATPRP